MIRSSSRMGDGAFPHGKDGLMAEENDTQVEVVEPQGEQPTETDWKREARKWERYAKENASASEELEKLREAQKTEEQKRADHTATLEKELAGFRLREQAREWAKEIVKDSLVPADALRGSTREELEEHFDVLSALIKPTDVAPVVVPTIGVSPSVGNVSLDDQIAAAQSAGNAPLTAALKAQKLGAIN